MKYTALTIGPIHSSLALARKTREFWGASYLFSYLMEQAIQKLLEKKAEHNFEILLPWPDKHSILDKIENNHFSSQVGIFPDRLFVTSETGMFDLMQTSVKAAKEIIAEEFSLATGEDCTGYVNNFLKTYIVEGEYNERKFEDTENLDDPVQQFGDFLSNCELQEKYLEVDPQYFIQFLENINQADLYKSVFKKGHFPSIVEITTGGLNLPKSMFDTPGEDEDVWNNIAEEYKAERIKVHNRELKEEACKLFGKLRIPHKYIALVQADGDNVGKLTGNIARNNPKLLPVFSKLLARFALKASNEIKEFGGEPVYAGGDDLLFFAPVINQSSNIVSLINRIDEIFKLVIVDNPELKDIIGDLGTTPSISYGLSVSYYKFPMQEALDYSGKLLFEKAKRTEGKNALAIGVQMHSGQTYTAILNKSSQFYSNDKFISFLNSSAENVISSVIYNLNIHKPVLRSIVHNQDRLESFFDNIYNEDIHKGHKDFIKMVCEFLYLSFTEEKDLDKALDNVYAVLRFVKFLNTKSHE
ncbi:MAG: type III-B CRISPR-associated protein Cas10/Cmr2 [Bacteroidales bacterium]|nr:type III-B CRISPR-associated protein Cas10/Cmr2 [Bacteroidales bacterium]